MHDHTQRIGERDPVHSVNEHPEIPIADSARVHAADESEVSSDHQPLNVVAVSSIEHLTNARFHTCHVSLGGPVKVGQFALLFKPVSIGVLGSFKPIDAAHEFAPTNDLPHKRLDRLQRSIAGFVRLNSALATLAWIEQLHVERTGEYGVVERRLASPHRIFVCAEICEAILDEVIE